MRGRRKGGHMAAFPEGHRRTGHAHELPPPARAGHTTDVRRWRHPHPTHTARSTRPRWAKPRTGGPSAPRPDHHRRGGAGVERPASSRCTAAGRRNAEPQMRGGHRRCGRRGRRPHSRTWRDRTPRRARRHKKGCTAVSPTPGRRHAQGVNPDRTDRDLPRSFETAIPRRLSQPPNQSRETAPRPFEVDCPAEQHAAVEGADVNPILLHGGSANRTASPIRAGSSGPLSTCEPEGRDELVRGDGAPSSADSGNGWPQTPRNLGTGNSRNDRFQNRIHVRLRRRPGPHCVLEQRRHCTIRIQGIAGTPAPGRPSCPGRGISRLRSSSLPRPASPPVWSRRPSSRESPALVEQIERAQIAGDIQNLIDARTDYRQ